MWYLKKKFFSIKPVWCRIFIHLFACLVIAQLIQRYILMRLNIDIWTLAIWTLAMWCLYVDHFWWELLVIVLFDVETYYVKHFLQGQLIFCILNTWYIKCFLQGHLVLVIIFPRTFWGELLFIAILFSVLLSTFRKCWSFFNVQIFSYGFSF